MRRCQLLVVHHSAGKCSWSRGVPGALVSLVVSEPEACLLVGEREPVPLAGWAFDCNESQRHQVIVTECGRWAWRGLALSVRSRGLAHALLFTWAAVQRVRGLCL